MNVKIHVLISFVAVELIVKPKLTELFVNVLPVCKVTHWFLALRLDALPALNVLEMKNVIIHPENHTPHKVHFLHEKNVNRYADQTHVLLEHHALRITIEKYVHATTLFKETDMFLVQNVSKLKIIH